MRSRFLRIFHIYFTGHFWSIVISIFLFVLLSFNSISSASTTDCITMQDGSIFTGTILPSIVKFKTKYGEMEVSTENIVSFSRDTLALKDQSKLIGNFSSGSIAIETSNKKLDFLVTEVVEITTKSSSMSGEGHTQASSNQKVSSSKKLSRDEAMRILSDLVISKYWYLYTRRNEGTSKSISIPPDIELALNPYAIGMIKLLRSYWSCLADKNLVTVKRENNWPNNLTSEGKMVLTETGQKYLDKDLEFRFKIIVNEITGIQFMNDNTVAKVYFNGTVESSDNPFNQCFEDHWDIQSLLDEPYALFELFDDGWRLKEWNSGVLLNELKVAKQLPIKKKAPSKEQYKELTNFEKLIADVKDAELFSTHSQVFPYRYDEVWDAVNYDLKKQKENITQSNKETGVIVSDSPTHWWHVNGKVCDRIDKYYIVIEKINETTSQLKIKLIIYYYFKDQSKTNDISLANERVGGLLKRVEKQLKKNK